MLVSQCNISKLNEGLTMLSFHKDATSKQNESIEEIEVLTTEVTKARISNSMVFEVAKRSSAVIP